MTTQQLLLFNLAAAMFLGTAVYFTRATFRRATAAIAGGVIAWLLFGIGVDVLAYSMGWWRYTFIDGPPAPVLAYTAAGLWYGATASLFAWRIARRFGWKGQAIFLLLVTICGPIRVYAVAIPAGWVIFAPGFQPVIAETMKWAGITALALGVMRLIAGPARNDGLTRARTLAA